RIGEDPTIAAYGSTPEWLWLTVGLSLLIGVVLGWLAWRGRQRWLLIWCVGLVICSLAYGGYELFAT
ncbi:MAG: hypothetical protein AAFU65_07865, partial [Pseudomonadota bacterium]